MPSLATEPRRCLIRVQSAGFMLSSPFASTGRQPRLLLQTRLSPAVSQCGCLDSLPQSDQSRGRLPVPSDEVAFLLDGSLRKDDLIVPSAYLVGGSASSRTLPLVLSPTCWPHVAGVAALWTKKPGGRLLTHSIPLWSLILA